MDTRLSFLSESMRCHEICRQLEGNGRFEQDLGKVI
jgi:hypothetical protein